MVLAWLRDILEILTGHGIGLALWNFRGPFGIIDSGRKDVAYEDFHGHKLDRKMLDLLDEFCIDSPGCSGHALHLLILELEYVFYRDTKGPGEFERQRQRGRVPAGFDGDDGLASHADAVGQLLLGQLAVVETQPANLVAESVTAHRRPPVRT